MRVCVRASENEGRGSRRFHRPERMVMLKQKKCLRQRMCVHGRTGPSCANMQCINKGTRHFKFELLRCGQDGPGVIGSAGALAACGVQMHRQVLL